MTISANYSFNPTVDTILRMALQRAGLLPLGRNPSAQELSHARDHMNATAKSLASMGANLMQMERATLALVAGTASYALPIDTVDVDFPMTVKASSSTTETILEQLVYAQYQQMATKDTQGTPTNVYVERQALVTLVLWPVPAQAFTLSYRRQRLLRDMDSGSTIDQRPQWFTYWIAEMAAQMSWIGSLTISDKKQLRQEANDAREHCMGRENEGGDLTWNLSDL